MENFIDEMLQEIEAKEEQLQLAHVDMVLKEISTLTADIQKILIQADEEKKIITDWAIGRSAKMQNRIDWLTGKLEAFMGEQEPSVRTIDLANGKLLKRKQIEKLVVDNIEEFLKNQNLYQLTQTQPETIKPDLKKIKEFYTMTGKIPLGTSLIESKDKFSIELKNGGIDGTSKNGTAGQSSDED